jgi:hypothetical protein
LEEIKSSRFSFVAGAQILIAFSPCKYSNNERI